VPQSEIWSAVALSRFGIFTHSKATSFFLRWRVHALIGKEKRHLAPCGSVLKPRRIQAKKPCEGLVVSGVVPYDMCQLDQVVGAGHFHLSIETEKSLVEQLRSQFSGYFVACYEQEIPAQSNKKNLFGQRK